MNQDGGGKDSVHVQTNRFFVCFYNLFCNAFSVLNVRNRKVKKNVAAYHLDTSHVCLVNPDPMYSVHFFVLW